MRRGSDEDLATAQGASRAWRVALARLLGAAPAAGLRVLLRRRRSGSPLIDAARLGVFLLLGGHRSRVLGGFVAVLPLPARQAVLDQAETEQIASEWARFSAELFD